MLSLFFANKTINLNVFLLFGVVQSQKEYISKWPSCFLGFSNYRAAGPSVPRVSKTIKTCTFVVFRALDKQTPTKVNAFFIFQQKRLTDYKSKCFSKKKQENNYFYCFFASEQPKKAGTHLLLLFFVKQLQKHLLL